MTTRRRARELAFQLLYELELNPDVPDARREAYVREHLRDPQGQRFALQLINGVRTKRQQLNEIIEQLSTNWSLERMGAVERVAIRLGLYEMLYQPDIPPPVAITEAVRIAKRYGDRDSYRFVNGLLDAARRKLLTPSAARPEPPGPSAGGGALAEETL